MTKCKNDVPVREAGRLTSDLHLPSSLLQIQFPILTGLCGRPPAVASPSLLPPSPTDHTDLFLQPSSLQLIPLHQPLPPADIPLGPTSHTSQGSWQANLSSPLIYTKSKPLDSSPVLQQTTCCDFSPPFSDHIFPTYYVILACNSSRHSWRTCQPCLPERKVGQRSRWIGFRSPLSLLSSKSNSPVSPLAL